MGTPAAREVLRMDERRLAATLPDGLEQEDWPELQNP